MNQLGKSIKRVDWHQRKWYASWHTWAGLFGGIVLIVVSLTGCILVFESEIDKALNPEIFEFKNKQNKAKVSLDIATKNAKAYYPDLNFIGIYIKDELNGVYELMVNPQEDTKNKQYAFTPMIQVFVNPYTGEVIGKRNYNNSFAGFIRLLHRTLLVPVIGKYLVGFSSLSCLLLMITGLRLWVPKKRRELKSRFIVNFKKPFKKVNYDLHNTLGFYFSPFISLLSLSGFMITFGQFFIIILFLLNFTTPAQAFSYFDAKSTLTETATPLSLNKVKNISIKAFPGAKIAGINFPRSSSGAYMAMLNEKSNSEIGSVLLVNIDQYSGKIINHSKEDSFKLANAYFNWIDGIHFGKFGGWPSRIMVFISSLMLAVIFVTGFILWIPRWIKGKKYIQKIDNT